MVNVQNICVLPNTLLCLAIAMISKSVAEDSRKSSELQWPYNLPHGMKYHPEDEPLVKSGLIAHQRLKQGHQPTAMQRMPPDDDGMFFLDYWVFDAQKPSTGNRTSWNIESSDLLSQPLLPMLKSPNPSRYNAIDMARYPHLLKRDFQCPSGFNSCSAIGKQFSCCASGSSCVLVADTGLGDVGCCPSGANCGGNSLGSCDNAAGYKSCPGSGNGGCCMPGFDCFNVGCISTSTSTTTTTLAAATVTNCLSGFNTCASSLGGGCCPSSLTCGSNNSCYGASTSTTVITQPTATTSVAPVAPVRPTEDPDATIPSIVTTGTQLLAICPTNFYFCSAYYRPGCCRIGRDCAMTNCPSATAFSTIVQNGVTVVVPVGASTGGQTYQSTAIITGIAAAATFRAGGSCANGWTSCAQNQGGGCCPGGYTCGALCTGGSLASGSVVAKQPPSSASGPVVDRVAWSLLIMGSVFGVIMILL